MFNDTYKPLMALIGVCIDDIQVCTFITFFKSNVIFYHIFRGLLAIVGVCNDYVGF
jgi:hypothetical protein